MKRLPLITLLASLAGFAQSVTKDLGDFDKITTFDQIDALLVSSDENKIVLNGKNAKDVEIVNKNGELKVRMPIDKLLQGDNISATIYYKRLEAVEANEGSRIAGEGTIEATVFDLLAKEGGEIDLSLDVEKLNAKASQGSKVHLAGKATNQDIVVNSGAEYDAGNLLTQQTAVTSNAGGNADVNASDLVEAKVRAGGNIRIYGRPKQVNEKTFAGGTIKRMD